MFDSAPEKKNILSSVQHWSRQESQEKALDPCWTVIRQSAHKRGGRGDFTMLLCKEKDFFLDKILKN